MSKISVVSTDWLRLTTVLLAEELSVRVPAVAEMWIPLPPGHPAAVPPVESAAATLIAGAARPPAAASAGAGAVAGPGVE
jgi:hypothetical protein